MNDMSEPLLLPDLWDEGHAAGLGEPERLVYRSRLLGSDPRLTVLGGGTTSAKLTLPDPLSGEPTEVLLVKAAGRDLAVIEPEGFAALRLDRLQLLKERHRGPEDDERTAGALALCRFGAGDAAPPIEAPLHAFLPARHVDHVHADAVLAIAVAKNSRELTLEVYGDRIGWLPWRRPGFELALMVEKFARAHPDAIGVILESQGLLTWGADPRSCYRTTLEVVGRAHGWLADKTREVPVFGGAVVRPPPADVRRGTAARLLPVIRGLVGGERRKVAHFDDSPAVLDFVNSRRLRELSGRGVACPDHFAAAKVRPVVIDPAATDNEAVVAAYRADYAARYERNRRPGTPPMRDPNPVVCLMPGLGLAAFAPTRPAARHAAEAYRNTIDVMRGAATVDIYVGLSEAEAFAIEYASPAVPEDGPRPGSLAGRVVLVASAGPGLAEVAGRCLAEGAVVALGTPDVAAVEPAVAGLAARFGQDAVRAVRLDPRDEVLVGRAFAEVSLAFGGIDVVVGATALATPAPLAETPVDHWNRGLDQVATGAFVLGRESLRYMRRQRLGGSIVFLLQAAAPDAFAGTGGSVGVDLARRLAREAAADGIRVNVVEAAGPADPSAAILFFAGDLSAGVSGTVVGVTGAQADSSPGPDELLT